MSTATLLRPEIQDKLSATRRKLRLVDLAMGLARALLAAALVAVLLFALDTALEPPLAVLRSFALFLAVVAAALVTLFLAIPIRRRLSDDDVALLVETEYPQLKDGLVSAVQLSREEGRQDVWTSRALIRSTIERTAREVAPLDFGAVVRTGPLLPLWVVILSLFGLGFFATQVEPMREYLDIFARRVVFGDPLGYPKLVGIRVGRPALRGVTLAKTAEGLARIEEVSRSSDDEPAFRQGDLVVGIEGQRVDGKDGKGFDELSRQLMRRRPGEEVAVELLREGKPTVVTGVVTTDVPEAVAKGDEVTVDVFVTKGQADQGLLVHTRYEGVEGEEVRNLDKIGPAHYRKTYLNVTNAFRFYVEIPAHGVRSPEYRVAVVQRPRIEQYEFVLDYPDYTAKPTEGVTQPDLQVPTGTEISYLVVSNKPLQSSRLVLELEALVDDPATGRRKRVTMTELGPPPRKLEELLAEPDAAPAPGSPPSLKEALKPAISERKLDAKEMEGRVLVGRFRVDRDLRFHYDLLSAEGYGTGKKPVVFSVRAVADRQPTVSIPLPGKRKQVTPGAKVPLQVEAADEYGIRSVDLRIKIESAGETAGAAAATEIALGGFQDGDKQVKIAHVLDMADLRVQPGDKLTYVAIAADHNIDEARQRKESREYELAVVRPEDLERILQDRLSALKDQLLAAAKAQTEAKTMADAFVGELGPKDVLADEDKRSLQRMGSEEKRVISALSAIQRELVDIKSERQLNRLEDDGAVALLDELTDGVRELAEKATPLIGREIEDARAAVRVDDALRTRMARVPDLMHAVIEALTALAARIDKWGDFTEVIQEWRDLRRDQDRLIEGTRDAARQQGTGPR